MMLKFKVNITVDAKEKTNSIFESINTDNKFYPENPTTTNISLQDDILISIESTQLSQLRANLNSILRLIQTSHDSIESVKI